jgi:hypothetical protein
MVSSQDAVANLLPAPPSTNPRLSIVLLNDGSVQLRLSGSSGFTWRTEASSDLSSWSAISTNTLTGGSVQFSERPRERHHFASIVRFIVQ